MRKILAGCVAAACALVMAPGAAYAALPTTRVVDDDGAQCGSTTYRTIGAAVAAARPGDTIRVCPGVYRERVDVTKPVHIIGQQDAVSRLTCVDQRWSSTDAVDTTKVSLVEPPDEAIAPLIRLRADGIELAGLVVQGQTDPENDINIYAPAIQADGANSGHRIHHNLVQKNTLGIEIGSNGSVLSQVDHNCLRGNSFDVANQRYSAINVRADHNETFRTEVTAFEASTFASATQGPLFIRNARFDHNRSVDSDYTAFYLEGAETTQVDHNSVDASPLRGVVVMGANKDITISHNQLRGVSAAFAGIHLLAPNAELPTPSAGVVIFNNAVTKFAVGIFVGFNAGTTSTQVVNNATSGNGYAGIQVGQSNTQALVKGNTSDRNAYGIRTGLPPTVGNSFVGNSMHGNTTLDAEDNSYPGNTWTGNRCDTDSPAGALCAH